jgi:hypothetical protein
MNVKDIKSSLNSGDIYGLLNDLGAQPRYEKGKIIAKTICHHGHSHKLYYLDDKKAFHCFTGCGSFDVFELVKKVYELDFYSSMRYITSKFGLSYTGGIVDSTVDMSFFEKFTIKDHSVKFREIDKNVLNQFYNYAHQSWLDDGINYEALQDFGVKYDIVDNKIVIPHFDKKSNLIGVRGRYLNPDDVARGMKYMPIKIQGEMMNHATGGNLYGLDVNLAQIKKHRTIILFESEKSVLQLKTMYPNMSIGVCISGSNLTKTQVELLLELDIDNVIIGVDKEFKEIGSQEEQMYAEKITKIFLNKLTPHFNCSILWDMENLLNEKDAPTDKGKEVFDRLMEKRILI